MAEIRERKKEYPENPGTLVAENLLPQLGTSPRRMAETFEFDEQILSNIEKPDVAFLTMCYQIPDRFGGGFYRGFAQNYMGVMRSVNGWTSKNFLHGARNTAGTPPSPQDKAYRPNIAARNIWNRNWKQKAEQQGKDIEGEE